MVDDELGVTVLAGLEVLTEPFKGLASGGIFCVSSNKWDSKSFIQKFMELLGRTPEEVRDSNAFANDLLELASQRCQCSFAPFEDLDSTPLINENSPQLHLQHWGLQRQRELVGLPRHRIQLGQQNVKDLRGNTAVKSVVDPEFVGLAHQGNVDLPKLVGLDRPHSSLLMVVLPRCLISFHALSSV